MNHKNIKKSVLASLTLSYFLLLVYASLMPYDFNFATDFKWALNRALSHWPINPHARVSGSDILSNLILYIPLGFLIAAQLNNKWTSWFKCCFFAFVFCSLTSLAVETAQAATFSRTASVTDWVMNSLSGFIGSYIGARYGQWSWHKSCDWISRRWQHSPLDIFTLLFAALIAADALAPFLPTLLLSQVWRSIKSSKFNIINGFSQHPWHWWLVNHIFVYMVLTILALHWGGQNKKQRSRLHAATICFLFAAVLELGKLFIASRVMNLSNLLANWVGILLAILVLKFWRLYLQRTVI
ncbi:MAG: VanZ family protein [Desulfuromusa sp.]|nr:VanZ family protein [Desulfuromusa sp.]